ncbi:MAG: deoxyhypusine synthase [Thermoplasmata archaeon]
MTGAGRDAFSRKVLLQKPVKDMELKEKMTADMIVKEMEKAGGFSAAHFATGVKILEKMLLDKACFKFFSTPACVFATGLRGVIREMVKRKMLDCIITTCGMLDHDLARTWKDYYCGDFLMDDSRLRDAGINRLGNVLVPDESYGLILEKKLLPILQSLRELGIKEFSTFELCRYLGEALDKNKIPNKEDSVLYWAYKNNIPVIVPGPTDGSVGAQLWMFYQEHKDLRIDLMKDEQFLSDIIFTAKKTGAVMIGGGISKHHTIWWNQFRGGLDYAVYITTAVEYDGSLSGARMREAVSWGKVQPDADYITIDGDASILLPFMIAAVLDRI